MKQQNLCSSYELMEKVINSKQDEAFTSETAWRFEKEIESNMEKFDREKKQKVAKAAEDLSRLVITS